MKQQHPLMVTFSSTSSSFVLDGLGRRKSRAFLPSGFWGALAFWGLLRSPVEDDSHSLMASSSSLGVSGHRMPESLSGGELGSDRDAADVVWLSSDSSPSYLCDGGTFLLIKLHLR